MVILTKRKIMENKPNNKKSCFDIVFEWENIFSKELNKKILVRSSREFKFDEKCRNLYLKTHISAFRLFLIVNYKRTKGIFMFDVSTKMQNGIYNNRKYVPCLIDYFLDDNAYKKFIKAYRKNPFVLVSSKEVYDYLIEKKCPIKLYHFPLSLPDTYQIKGKLRKEYDLVMFARQNPLLVQYINRYEKNHFDFKLVRRKFENNHYVYYLSSNGEIVSTCDTLEEYMNLVGKSKVAVYTTPGMDNTRTDANGWNQVTPHFLEEIAGQCHIIARYPDNADTRWYNMEKICKNVESYEEFEKLMDQYRTEEVDMDLYRTYLSEHLTSKRADLLKDIFTENNLFD